MRILTAVLVAARLWSAHTIPLWEIAVLVVTFLSVNVISCFSNNESPRTHTVLAVLQLIADTLVVLLVTFVQRGRTDTADWALLVLPVIEGAIQFQILGAMVTWIGVSVGYAGWTLVIHHDLPAATVVQRLAIVLLVALPSGFLAENLVDEIAAHRRGRDEAEHRGSLLRARGAGRAPEHESRCRRDPRSAARHRGRHGLLRRAGVRARR